MGRLTNVFSALLQGAKRAFKSPRGPAPQLFSAKKTCLTAFNKDYARSSAVQIGERVLKKEGEESTFRHLEVSDLVNKPLLLELGVEKGLYRLALYALEKNGKYHVVVADLSKAALKDMSGPDLYVIEEDKFLDAGRSSRMGLSASYASVSGHHLSIFFPAGSSRVFVGDFSSNGTVINYLKGSQYLEIHSDVFPAKIKPSMI